MAVFTRGQAPDVYDLWPIRFAFLRLRQNPESFRQVVKVTPSDAAFEDIARFSGLGRFQLKPEGEPVTYDIPVQGVRRRTSHATYGLGTAMTREALADARFDVLRRQTEALARSARDHRERLAWDLFDDSFNGTRHTSIDGVAICSTAHDMLKPLTVGQTRSNRLTPFVPLSLEGLEAATVVFATQISEEGHQIGEDLRPRNLVHPSALMHVANTVLDARGRPGTDDPNSPNTISKFGIMPIGSPYLTSTSAWWLTTGAEDSGMEWLEREAPTMSNSTDADTGDRKWRMLYRASVRSTAFEGIVGTTP